jgi:transcriptional regulator with XRE-family HTH domain
MKVDIRKILRAKMQAGDVSTQGLAKRAGLSRLALMRYLNGQSDMRASGLEKVLGELGLTITDAPARGK